MLNGRRLSGLAWRLRYVTLGLQQALRCGAGKQAGKPSDDQRQKIPLSMPEPPAARPRLSCPAEDA